MIVVFGYLATSLLQEKSAFPPYKHAHPFRLVSLIFLMAEKICLA